MTRSRRRTQLDDDTSSLLWAKKFLAVAGLVQLPFLLSILFHVRLPGALFGPMVVVSAVCGILGFVITNRELDLRGEALESSPTGPLIGPNLKAGMALFFYGAFLLPLLNLVIIVWTYSRASSAVRALRALHEDALAKQERRARLSGGPSDAFRNVP